MMDTITMHLSKPTIRVTPRVNPKVNYKLQVITMCRFKEFNKCTTMVQDTHSVGSWGDGRGHTHTHILSVQLCCKPKTALKK